MLKWARFSLGKLDYKDLNCYQKDRIEHNSNNINYRVNSEISSYYDTRNDCRSVQHIIEVF